MLPASVISPLKLHLANVKALHKEDVASGFGDAYLPYALDKKYPKAGSERRWQYVFLSAKLSVDLRSGIPRRYHLDEKGIRAMKQAVRDVGIVKPAPPHTL